MDTATLTAPLIPGSRRDPASHAVALAAFALGLYLYLGSLNGTPLQRGNEAMYAYPPIHMLESGDYLLPRYEGKEFLEKPPLAWWIIAASYRFLGISVLAERLPSSLASLATILLVGWWTRGRSGERAGSLAGLILMFSFQFLIFTMTYAADAFLTLAVLIAVVTLDRALRREEGSDAGWGAGCGAALALAFYFKGLAGIVLPVGSVAAGLLIDREKPHRVWRRGAWAASCLLALLAPWHWAMTRRLGAGFWSSFYWRNQFLRGTTRLYMRPRGPFYYLGVLAWAVFPWSLFLPGAIRRRPPSSVPVGWLAFAMAFWSLLVMKREVYLMPLFPAVAVLVAETESEQGSLGHRWRHLPWILAAAAGGLILVLWLRAFGTLADLAGTDAAVLAGIGIVGFVAAFGVGAMTPGGRLSPLRAALAVAILLLAIRNFESRLSRFDPLPAWGERVRAECASGCDGFLYGIDAYSIDFYSRLDWSLLADPGKELPPRLRHRTGFIVMWTDSEPVLARLPWTSQVLDRRSVFQQHWATALWKPAGSLFRSLSFVRIRQGTAEGGSQSGGADSAAGAPEESVRHPIAPSTTAPPAIE
ncbi:MAG TPA: glycosyltransferase family 39 protein [Thermoanaerobaculia bacterium]